MKFGKQIQANQIPGWSAYYLDYKALKKIISLLTSKTHDTPAPTATVASSVRPTDLFHRTASAPDIQSPIGPQASGHVGTTEYAAPTIISSLGLDEDRSPDFQAHKAAFFFKLERELEKINAFYLQKEAELKLRLETLLAKRRAAAMRVLPDTDDDNIQNHVEWIAVQEGFRLLERDLGKLQQFIEMNATGFRKILKKWDKRSKSSTKELYLARQVDVQPVFNRQLISEMSDTVAACLLDITDLSTGLKVERPAVDDIVFTHQLSIEGTPGLGPFRDLESNLRQAVANADTEAIREIVHYSDTLSQQQTGKTNVTRILWKAVIDAPPDFADLIMSSTTNPFDFQFVDDINGRTCLHEVAIAGILRLVDICLGHGVERDKTDLYGRSALHYACMNGHAEVCRRLLNAGLSPVLMDMDNYSPLVYAILSGNVDCVRALLDIGQVQIKPSEAQGDLMPLSLAAQSGYVEIVLLLLQHGAESLPNTNGEYPIHLAARAGHAAVVHELLSFDGWDTPDKYSEWTPLFHAARYGHRTCVEVLLGAGACVDHLDESGNMAVHYAAWYGYRDCVDRLLEAATRLPISLEAQIYLGRSPPSSGRSQPMDMDIDMIPSLSLPPPIMPYRVYGHNYLDKNCLVQVSVGHFFSRYSEYSRQPSIAVRLDPRLNGAQPKDRHALASSFLKLVMTSATDATTAPFSLALPVKMEEMEVFTFQIPSIDALRLEFSICPNFGNKTIARAVALPFALSQVENTQPFMLPMLDHRLQVIGEISFEVNIIKPFRGVQLEIGGAIETYWKSLVPSAPPPFSPKPGLQASPSRPPGSTQTSPSIRSAIAHGGHTSTTSSVTGQHIHVTVQVTRDLHPVVYDNWRLPVQDYDLGVSDLTLAQFEVLARRLNRSLDTYDNVATTQDWKLLRQHMCSLGTLMQVLPFGFGLSIDIAYPPAIIRKQNSLRHRIDLNEAVDSVLRTIYHTSSMAENPFDRRRFVFMSSSPDVCSSLNWKQPNYPVFFVSQCGQAGNQASPTTLTMHDADDRRLSNLGSAVEFAKANNLLGICLDAQLLTRVPSLIQGIKDMGLIVGTYGSPDNLASLSALAGSSSPLVDAVLQEGLLNFTNHAAPI